MIKMKNNFLVAIALSITVLSCGDQKNEKETSVAADTPALATPEAPPPPEAPVPPPVQEYKTKTGKVFLLEESHPKGMSLSDIKVSFADDKNSELSFSDLDPLNKVLVGDLDKNGYDELYVITTAAGSGSYGNLRGFASLRDKSIGMVNLPDLAESDMAKGGKFEGYEGHDEFNIVNNELVRTFPVKSDKGTKRTVVYKMVQGEAAYQLVVKSSSVN
jgi:hypothetical protein